MSDESLTPEELSRRLRCARNQYPKPGKREAQRKAAIAYADTGSPVQPVTFPPVECTGCGIKLNSQNHTSGRQCYRCATEVHALAKPSPIPWQTVTLFCAFVVAPCAAGATWLLAEAVYRLGAAL